MTRLLFLVDGERDAAMLPPLVETITGGQVDPLHQQWARLHGAGRGYARKLLFEARVAKDTNASGVVAVVDRDKSHKGSRLAELKSARDQLSQRGDAIPIALGEADPHGEVWLLDDATAVRTAMQLPKDAIVPATAQARRDAKDTLHSLLQTSPRRNDRPLDVWRDIAQQVNPDRCAHRNDTGFGDFADEVRREIQPLCSPSNDPPSER